MNNQKTTAAPLANEAIFRAVFAQSAVGIARTDAEGNFLECNPAFCALVGRTQEALATMQVSDLTHPEDYQKELEMVQVIRNNPGQSCHLEKRYLHQDGTWIWVDLTISPVLDAEGRTLCYVGLCQNINARKQMEQALRDSEMSYRLLFANNPQPMWVYDVETLAFLEINQAALHHYGYTREEFLAMTIKDIRPLEDVPALLVNVAKVSDGLDLAGIWRHRRKDGSEFQVEITSHTLAFGGRRAELVLATEVTERERARAALRLQSAVLQSAANAIVITDREGQIVFVNEAFSTMTGYDAEEVLGKNPRFLNSGRHDKPFFARMWHNILSGKVWHSEVVNRRKNGSIYTQEQTITPVHDQQGRITHFVAIQQDITTRKRMETELRHSRERFQKIFQANPVAIGICVQADSKFLDMNENYLKMIGYSRAEIIGKSASELSLWARPEQRAQLVEALRRQGAVTNFELQLKSKTGQRVDVLSSVQPIQLGLEPCWLFIDVDITARKNLEAQLRQAAKMESIGTLAGGVAHDFNNLLTVIQGHTELLNLEPALGAHAQESLRQIAAAAERAANLTRQLLTFSRKQPLQPKSLDLNEVLGQLTKMLQRIIGEDIALEVTFAPQLPAIMADAGMIEQVIFNLAVNARDAMPEGGSLTIKTEEIEFSLGESQPRRPGQFIRLSVQDRGCGIPLDIQPRIFEPFFTTKETGKGTGLGLATVHGIVEQHRGWIEFVSEINVGTTFYIYLPTTTEVTASPSQPINLEVRGGTETLLVVEDEAVVRSLAREVLILHGYKVLEASCAHEAFKVWKEHQADIALMLTDVVMPEGINGFALARQLRQDRPALKVLFSSGYASPEGLRDEASALANGCFLQKPYSPNTLAQMVRDLLDR